MYYVAEQHNEGEHPYIYRIGVPTLSQAKTLLRDDMLSKQKQIDEAGVRHDVRVNGHGTWYYLRYGFNLQNHTEYMILKEVGHKTNVPDLPPLKE